MKEVRQINWYQLSPDHASVTVSLRGYNNGKAFILTQEDFYSRFVKPEPANVTDYSLYVPDVGSLRDV